MAPTLYLLCGLPASGKTTRARELEAATNAVRLTGDEWIARLYPNDAEAAARDERRDTVEQLQWQIVERLLEIGTDVVLDWGLWTRAERARYRRRAEALGARVKIELVEAPLSVLQERLAERNRDLPPGTFHISATEMEEFASLFERPTEVEMAVGRDD
ncbi:MAG: ATP-binding protein [bacterium]|nr:ATP-binding protein [bacterium]